MTPLLPLPEGFASTRRALHLISFYAFSYARQQVDGEVWLTPTPGGMGTPPFGGRTLRFEGVHMVEDWDGIEATRRPITTLRAALAFAGVGFDRPRGERNDIEMPVDLDEVFAVDAGSARVLASFYALGQEVLDKIVESAPDGDLTKPRLWNEHFDLAVELGSDADGLRASMGFSPGDRHLPDPYVYVAPWSKNETVDLLPPTTSFGGVALQYSDLLGRDHPAEAAEAFLQDARRRLGHI